MQTANNIIHHQTHQKDSSAKKRSKSFLLYYLPSSDKQLPFFHGIDNLFYSSGAKKLVEDIEATTGRRVSRWWIMCWKVVTPSMVVVSESFCLNIQIATKTVKCTSLPVINKCNKMWDYSPLSLNGHLYKTNTSLIRTRGIGPCRFSVILL